MARHSKTHIVRTDTPSPLSILLISVLGLVSVLLFIRVGKDAISIFRWWITILVLGLTVYPLTSSIFSRYQGKGYAFSKAIGILLPSFLVWTLVYLKIVPLNIFSISISVLLIGVVSWGKKDTRTHAISALKSVKDRDEIIIVELMFLVVLLFLCYIKGFFPEINGEEKFMDYAFLNSLVRTNSLPAPDPWLAGSSINYYYYGQYIYAFITRLSGLSTSVTYMMSICTTLAIAFIMAFGLSSMLFDYSVKKGVKAPSSFRAIAGLVSAFSVCFFGNAHSFFYDEKSIGNVFLRFLSRLGINTGKTDSFFYPNSTRFIGHNPDSRIVNAAGELIQNGDYTIHEFPYYSYLIGDLHAHYVGTMVILLILAVLFVVVTSSPISEKDPSSFTLFGLSRKESVQQARFEISSLFSYHYIVIASLLAICTMCNYWDFLIYFIASAMAILIAKTLFSKHFSTWPGAIIFAIEMFAILFVYLKYSAQPERHFIFQMIVLCVSLILTSAFPCALSRTSMVLSFIFTFAFGLSMPFHVNFDMISSALLPVESRTGIYQFFMVWGVHFTFAILFIVFVIILSSRKLRQPSSKSEIKTSPSCIISRFFNAINPADLFVCGLAAVGFIMLLLPELFYVVDIYGGDYKRANTMFKFTFQAFIILSVITGYITMRFFSYRKETKNIQTYSAPAMIVAVLLSASLAITMHYPLVSTEQRSGDLKYTNYKGIDGTVALKTRNSPQLNMGHGSLLSYAQAIDYLNDNVTGIVNIVEAYGYSYTDNCLVSSYTGLPTIFGWYTHEWLWRFQGVLDNNELVQDKEKPDLWQEIINPRRFAVEQIYTSTDVLLVQSYLNQYEVKYIIVGLLERNVFPNIQDDLIKSHGQIVFETNDLYIVKVNS